MNTSSSSRAYITLFTLIFLAVFATIIVGVVNYALTDKRVENTKEHEAKAFAAAEAGVSYYLWHLGVFPNDTQDGTGTAGPYVHSVAGTSGTDAESFSLELSGQTLCGTLASLSATSTGSASGTASVHPITVRYGSKTMFTPGVSADFSKLASSLAIFKAIASAQGTYLPASGAYGYKIIFNNGSFSASPVTAVRQVWGYSAKNGWVQENSIITTAGATVNYTPPALCPVVFVEDNAWVSGTVSGKVTLVAGGFSGADKNIYLPDNLTYAHAWGDGILLIGQGDVSITLPTPDSMTLKGGFIAIDGTFGRNEYLASGAHAVPADLASYTTRSTLSILGTALSAFATTTSWKDGSGNLLSGYATLTGGPDRMLWEEPPALAPTTTSAFTLVEWRQK